MTRRTPARRARRLLEAGLKVADAAAVAIVGLPLVAADAIVLTVGRRRRSPGRRLLVLDACYSLEMLEERRLTRMVTARDLDGYFEHVWSVHPLVGASPEHSSRLAVGPLRSTLLDGRHTVVEGTVGRYRLLRPFPLVNFLAAQSSLLLRLHAVVAHEGIGVITAHDPFYLGVLGLVLARANGIPLTITIIANYDAIYESSGALAYPRLLRRRWVEQWLQRFVLPRADSVGFGSQDNLDYVLENGVARHRTAYFAIGDLIEPVHFADAAGRPPVGDELGLGSRPFAMSVGRLEPVKHPDDVLAAVAEARREMPELAAVIVGDGVLRGELEEAARRLGLEGHVVFAGVRDQWWLARAYSDAAVVLSTITGRALIEAGLSATPVVAYDVEWQPEFILHGETGVIVPYRDTVAMGKAVCGLLGDRRQAAEMGMRGRERALALMDPAASVSEKRRQYEPLLGGDPGGSSSTGADASPQGAPQEAHQLDGVAGARDQVAPPPTLVAAGEADDDQPGG